MSPLTDLLTKGGQMTGGTPLIAARGLVKRFRERTAVDGIDVTVQPGEAFGFLGPNGAGKTSTMRMIGCVSPPTAGELAILGMDPLRQGPAIRARFGVCPQEDNLDQELTAWENLTTMPATSACRAKWPAGAPTRCWRSCSWKSAPAARCPPCPVA